MTELTFTFFLPTLWDGKQTSFCKVFLIFGFPSINIFSIEEECFRSLLCKSKLFYFHSRSTNELSMGSSVKTGINIAQGQVGQLFTESVHFWVEIFIICQLKLLPHFEQKLDNYESRYQSLPTILEPFCS